MHTPKRDIGWPRPYLRDGVPGMSLDRQLEMMRTAGIDVSDVRMLYIDRLTKAAQRLKEVASLKERDEVLNPGRSGEAIYVAGLRVLGWTMADIARAVARAWRKKAVVYCVDIDKVFAPDIPPEELLEAIADADDATRRAGKIDRQIKATDVAAKKRMRRRLEKIDLARPKWRDPKYTVQQISAEVGLSRRTLYNELGPRWQNDTGKPHV